MNRPGLLLAAAALLLTACADVEAPRATASTPAAATTTAATAVRIDPNASAFDRAMARGRVRNAIGDHDGAEAAFREALAQTEGKSGPDSAENVAPLLQLALTASFQRRSGEADRLFDRAERLLARPVDPWDAPRLASYRAAHMAGMEALEPAYELARSASITRNELLRVAVGRGASIETIASGLAELAHGLVVEATIALRLGRLDAAEVAANLARRVLVDMRDVPGWWLAEIDEVLGLIEAERKRFGRADARIGASLAEKQIAFGEKRPVAMTLLSLGRIRAREGASSDALGAIRRGVSLLRADRSASVGLSASRISDILVVAEQAAGAGDPASLSDEMFQASQMAWRGVTARTISLTVARIAGDSDVVTELQRVSYERDLQRIGLGREAAKPPESRDEARLAELQESVRTLTARAAELSAALEASAPGTSQLIDSAPVSGKDLGALLAPDEAVLSFLVGAESSWAFVVRNDRLQVKRLSVTAADLADQVRTLRRAFTPGAGGITPAFNLDKAHDLYDMLIAPVEDSLAGVAHLIVVPDGALQSLPFAVLVTKPPTRRDAGAYTDAAWLAKRHAISTVPSVRAFADIRRLNTPSRAPLPFFGVGAPELTGRGGGGMVALENSCREDGPAPPDLVRALTPLPSTAVELRRVSSALGGAADSVLIGNAATEPRFRAAALNQYRILYFATHGLLPGELKCQTEPALVLTPPDQAAGSTNADGLLTASEIAGMNLDADLVVLSACNTASPSGAFGGEALSGLARSFFHAGARALLVTHWQVDSQATTDLMTGAFGSTNGGSIRFSDRLQAAQSKLIARPETAHPFFWGAFVLIGDGRAASRVGAGT